MSKFHDNLTFSSEVTEVLVKQLFSISKQWIKKKVSSVNQTLLFNGGNTVEAKQWLDKRYGDFAPGKSTIIDWYAEFKCGRTNTDDAERSGRLKSAVVSENITKVHKIQSVPQEKVRVYSESFEENLIFLFWHISTHKALGRTRLINRPIAVVLDNGLAPSGHALD